MTTLMDTTALQQFAAGDDDGPFQLLTLLRYASTARLPATSELAGTSGEAAYARYFDKLRPLIEAAGGQVVQFAPINHVLLGALGAGFDALSIVRYPSRSALMGMLGAFEYSSIASHRVAALDDSVVLALPDRESGR